MEPRWCVNVSELSAPGEPFVDFPAGFLRRDFSALPENGIERAITNPKISRYRAALQATLAADDVPIISHLPRMTAAVSLAQGLLRRRSPHMAFSFNFTELPRGLAKEYLGRSFRSVEKFCVFSGYEQDLYSDYFGLPRERFRRLLWTQDAPLVDEAPSPFPQGGYVSAVGGEGRDYATLVKAAERLPDIDFVIIARLQNALPSMPPNVRILFDVPSRQTWRIAKDSSCLVVPLTTRTTCCGHITLVSAQLLGIPVISTRSAATTEYTEDLALCEPGDADALAGLIREHHASTPHFRRLAEGRVAAKQAKHSREHWNAAVADFLLARW